MMHWAGLLLAGVAVLLLVWFLMERSEGFKPADINKYNYRYWNENYNPNETILGTVAYKVGDGKGKTGRCGATRGHRSVSVMPHVWNFAAVPKGGPPTFRDRIVTIKDANGRVLCNKCIVDDVCTGPGCAEFNIYAGYTIPGLQMVKQGIKPAQVTLGQWRPDRKCPGEIPFLENSINLQNCDLYNCLPK